MRVATGLPTKVLEAFDAYELHVGLGDIFVYLREANRQFARRAPWTDAKTLLGDISPSVREATAGRLGEALAEQVYGLAIVARCLLPFLPKSAEALHTKLGIPLPEFYRDPLIVDGAKTASEAVLFPRRLAS